MHLSLAVLLLAGLASAYDLPDNLKQIYDNHKVCMALPANLQLK